MTALFTAAAVTVTSFAACSKNEEINGIDPSAPVAHIENPPNGKKDLFTIKYSDFFGEYNFFMARGGYTEENDAELALSQRDNVIKYLAQERIILYLAEQAGITEKTFTEEEKKAYKGKACCCRFRRFVGGDRKRFCSGYHRSGKGKV